MRAPPEENGLKEFVSGAKNGMVESTRLLAMVKENDEIYSIDPSRVTRNLKFMMELLDFAKERWKKSRWNKLNYYNKSFQLCMLILHLI